MQFSRAIVVLALGCAAALPASKAESPAGTWHLSAAGRRITVVVAAAKGRASFTGTLRNESGGHEALDSISWDAATGQLEFRRNSPGALQWFRGRVVEGVFAGRFSQSTHSEARPARLEDYAHQVTGWNNAVFDKKPFPRVYELLVDEEYRVRLRLDSPGVFPGFDDGALKAYATVSGGADGEELEEGIAILGWDEGKLAFRRRRLSGWQWCSGDASGRTTTGICMGSGARMLLTWKGERAELLTYGGRFRSRRERAAWQQVTRRRLAHLLMAGNPAPLSTTVTVVRSGLPPIESKTLPPERDDDPARWPQDYRLSELQFDYTLPNPYGGTPVPRRVHAYLSVPNAPPPAGGKSPALLLLNGHGGSAWRHFDPDQPHYWFGDAFARRGFIVLAIDVSHRPLDDRRLADGTTLYTGSENGDDPENGNGAHPAIRAPGFDSDWEEDGERAWDAMRGLDYLLSLGNVDPKRVGVSGLSMGGTVAALAAALDTRFTFAIPAAAAADTGVMLYKGNHSCWLWRHGDPREYLDSSDLYALIAPRPLIVLTGKTDATYSRFSQPFAADKQALRRARAAYAADSANLIHYLHYDGHRFHVGDTNPTQPRETGVRVPVRIAPPFNTRDPSARDWQTDAETKLRSPNLFDLLVELWRRGGFSPPKKAKGAG